MYHIIPKNIFKPIPKFASHTCTLMYNFILDILDIVSLTPMSSTNPRTPSPPCALDSEGNLKDATDIDWFQSPPDALPLFLAGEISAEVSPHQPKTRREQEPVVESGVTLMTTQWQATHVCKSVHQVKIQKCKAGTKQGLAKDTNCENDHTTCNW